jgi:P-type Ca2+ transporter type 2C
LAISLVPVALIVLATELPGLNDGLGSVPLTGNEWLACIGLALLLPIVVELTKLVRRMRAGAPQPAVTARVVAPTRAVPAASA